MSGAYSTGGVGGTRQAIDAAVLRKAMQAHRMQGQGVLLLLEKAAQMAAQQRARAIARSGVGRVVNIIA